MLGLFPISFLDVNITDNIKKAMRRDEINFKKPDVFVYDMLGNQIHLRLCLSNGLHSNYTATNSLVTSQYFYFN